MKQHIKNIIHSTDGSALIELALILPLFLVMMVGVVDYGSAFVRKMEFVNAAKAGVQYAMADKPTNNDLTNVIAAVNNNLGASIDQATVTVNRYCKCDGVVQSCNVTCGASGYMNAFIYVRITEDFTPPFFNYSWFADNFPIMAESTIQLD